MEKARKDGLARNRAAEKALLEAILEAKAKRCTEIIMGKAALEFLYDYFHGHSLIRSKGVAQKVRTTEKRHNLFQVLVRLANSVRTFYRPD